MTDSNSKKKKVLHKLICYIIRITIVLTTVLTFSYKPQLANASIGVGGWCAGYAKGSETLNAAKVLLRLGKLVEKIEGNWIYFSAKENSTPSTCLDQFTGFFPFWLKVIPNNDSAPSSLPNWQYAAWGSSYLGRIYDYAGILNYTYADFRDGTGWHRVIRDGDGWKYWDGIGWHRIY